MVLDLIKTAELSRLELPENTDLLEKQMNDIMNMVAVLSEAEDMGTENSEIRAALREDGMFSDTMSENDIFGNAPSHENGYFCVPGMVK
ncbi:Asp-tRNA(Asn)/Glu-tRNA(Gln) amidotransferase subunit GatC [Ruminococcus sp. FC2018]|uniref:Asp-tRNA(Asn)/Glu-tRNA(Gln) amidotransferase subunit GatC n=1 Tax=Ruminococcus sp. FC2018 TaxID=1410617 RepID=UPI000559ECA0|nr:Asp-tRNA(Asn)/Glu-tRNA(Gln) amidotransferase subunit GatC [Ruminococcus sp. FC2018]